MSSTSVSAEMSQGAGVTSAAAPPSSSVATTAAPLTSPTSVTIPQWKYDLLQRRKTNNCPKTIGAQHNHHQQQQNSLTQLKHGKYIIFCCYILNLKLNFK